MTTPPLLDVIIPTATYGSRTDDLLSDLARELMAFEERVGRIVVVDNTAVTDVKDRLMQSGRDKSYERPSPVNGPAVNRNRGARDSAAQWLVFLDDDVRLEPGWGSFVVTCLGDEDAPDLIGGRIGSQRPRNWFSQAAEDFVVRHREYPEGWYLAAANLAVRREAFEALDGFSENFPYGGEDWDLSQRAHARGLSVGVNPRFSVRHANPTTWPQLALKARQYGRANAVLDAPAMSVGEDQAEYVAVPKGETAASPDSAHFPSPRRALAWVRSEYGQLRSSGRGRLRSARTTALYVPWMVIYLKAQRGAA